MPARTKKKKFTVTVSVPEGWLKGLNLVSNGKPEKFIKEVAERHIPSEIRRRLTKHTLEDCEEAFEAIKAATRKNTFPVLSDKREKEG